MTDFTISLNTGSFITNEEVCGYATPEECGDAFPNDMEEAFHMVGAGFLVNFVRYIKREHGDDYSEGVQEGGANLCIYFDDNNRACIKMINLIEKTFKKHIKGGLLKMQIYEGTYLP